MDVVLESNYIIFLIFKKVFVGVVVVIVGVIVVVVIVVMLL